MQLPIYQVDAFTDTLFKGNYAAVVPLQQWLPPEVMQAVAAENNLSETAFILLESDGRYAIRWFSPLSEIDFCGHATLASAFVLFRLYPELNCIRFTAAAVGELKVERGADGRISMCFPRLDPEPVATADIPEALLDGLSVMPQQVLVSRQAWFAVYSDEQSVLQVQQQPELLKLLAPRDVVVTAPGIKSDFVSRYFWPANGGLEDSVTGSIHAGLAPYWADRLGRQHLLAFQASSRGGRLDCVVTEQQVQISGSAVLYLEGQIYLP
ncbi:MAG: PhzF family phenazine biosynthesis protein [Halopseudomonas sp.]|uniref:PhzF family phenazine biosynthesis protein n=1 Tax=Halopseudomonas sp. TaxID=2901191 RepID=UPI0030029A41